MKKNILFSIYSSSEGNYIFHKLSVNTKHSKVRLCMGCFLHFQEESNVIKYVLFGYYMKKSWILEVSNIASLLPSATTIWRDPSAASSTHPYAKAVRRRMKVGNDLNRQTAGSPHGWHWKLPYARHGPSALVDGINGGFLPLSSSF
jgi:hypothetical protein